LEITLASASNTLLMVVIGVVVLGILVFIHELGHFIAAKMCGIRVLTFSLGFGTPLVKKEYKGTVYQISAIPFGGFVKMAGEHPDDTNDKKPEPDEFPAKPVWQRAFVAVAGPAANLIAAIAMLWVMYMYGVEQPKYLEHPIIGAISEKSSAETAGLQAGDSIIQIDNRKIGGWDDITNAFMQQSRQYAIKYIRNGSELTATITMEKSEKLIPDEPLGGLLPPLPAIIARVNPNSPAEKSGLMKGDTIRSINNQDIYSWYQVLTSLKQYKENTTLSIVVARTTGLDTITAVPKYNQDEKRYIIGMMVDEGEKRIVQYPPGAAFSKGIKKSWDFTTDIFGVLGKLISQEVSVKQLSGPVGIIPASGFVALQGISNILFFMAVIGINLAILNLLPLVITDGGMLLFLLIEAVRRKPLSIKTQMTFNKIAIVFFLTLFLYVTFNDVRRLPEYFQIFNNR
jgi:regulator of sigma E protease